MPHPEYVISDEQRRLARHALGLNYHSRSYRNRFCAVNGTPAWHALRGLVNAGLAWRIPWGWAAGDLFGLTRTGAEAVLLPGEELDSEDFP